MTAIDQISPMANRRLAVLVYDGLSMFEFALVAEVFGLERPEAGDDWYRFTTASIDGKPVKTQYGGLLSPQGDIRSLLGAGTIVIPGWSGIADPVPADLVAALQRAHREGARLVSICSGAVVLAAAKLLDGHRATTHWRYAEVFRSRFPGVELDPDVLYVDTGQVLTSAGSAAGLDLCLHLVRRDFGSEMANVVARRLVIAPHREGGQAQFVPKPVVPGKRNTLSPLLDRMRRSLDKQHSIAELASSVGLSERTFLRRFKVVTGTSPNEWLTEARLQHARELLERTDLPIDLVAHRSGFGTAMTLRHHFRLRLQTSPIAYRKRFNSRVVT